MQMVLLIAKIIHLRSIYKIWMRDLRSIIQNQTLYDGDVRIQRLEEGDEHSFGSMFYNIFIVKDWEDNSTIESASQLANLYAGETFRLTFTYDVGSPRYFIVNGEVVDFKHIRPEGGKPGSVTISAKAVEPVPSASYDPSVDGRLSHTFGVSVEMGENAFTKEPSSKQMLLI